MPAHHISILVQQPQLIKYSLMGQGSESTQHPHIGYLSEQNSLNSHKAEANHAPINIQATSICRGEKIDQCGHGLKYTLFTFYFSMPMSLELHVIESKSNRAENNSGRF